MRGIQELSWLFCVVQVGCSSVGIVSVFPQLKSLGIVGEKVFLGSLLFCYKVLYLKCPLGNLEFQKDGVEHVDISQLHQKAFTSIITPLWCA